ncbi:MAG: hypothetical protein FJ279_26970 [Planctomycetes bacterium]|nr:hypothetical protein [Planctomycetota bacterium]
MRRILIVILVLAAIVAALAILNRERFQYYRFDPELWMRLSPVRERQKRYYMARYLIDHGLLVGKSHTEVVAMLGLPEADGKDGVLYDLGPERGSLFAIDHDWLEIQFGHDGRVKGNRIRPD